MDEDYKKWLTQFRKGYIELCILLCLKREHSLNGSALLDVLDEVSLNVSEGTLYPLLNRMEQNGLLESLWKMPEDKGHPKKEYKLTLKSKDLLPKILSSYEEYQKSIEKLKG